MGAPGWMSAQLSQHLLSTYFVPHALITLVEEQWAWGIQGSIHKDALDWEKSRIFELVEYTNWG